MKRGETALDAAADLVQDSGPALRLALALFRALTWPLAWLPLRWGQALGSRGGRIAFFFWRRRRDIAVANIRLIQEAGGLPGELDPVLTARRSFQNLGRSVWEVLVQLHRSVTPFLSAWDVEGAEHLQASLDRARREGRGLLIPTGHCGNWELLCQLVARRFDFKLHIVGRALKDALTNALIAKIRTGTGNKYILKTGSARSMLLILKNGGVLGTLYDQAAIVNGEGIMLDFLGRPAATNLGPLRLARRTGAIIQPCFFRRQGCRHVAVFLPTLPDRPPDAPQATLAEDAQILNDLLSDFIRRHPEDWLWGHRRWKTRSGVSKNPQSLT